MIKRFRLHGRKPYRVVVIHGGPGAPGSAKPLAEILGDRYGVIEPFWHRDSIDGQVEELRLVVEKHCSQPITLVGHSWGAWLAYIFAAEYPAYVNKLVLIGSGPYKPEYVQAMNETRANRFSEEEKERVSELAQLLHNPGTSNIQAVFKELGGIMTRTDSYMPVSFEDEVIEYQPETFLKIMSEAASLRKSGELLAIGRRIKCPVTAIHGDYDPHPYQGVKNPLSQIIADFRFILLENCGHYPWNEVLARNRFCHEIQHVVGGDDKSRLPANGDSF